MGWVSDVVADNHLRDAVEGRRILLQHQTDCWGRSAGNVIGGVVPRGQDENELLQHAADHGGLT